MATSYSLTGSSQYNDPTYDRYGINSSSMGLGGYLSNNTPSSSINYGNLGVGSGSAIADSVASRSLPGNLGIGSGMGITNPTYGPTTGGYSTLGDSIASPGEEPGFFDDIFSNQYKMGNITGLASTLFQAAALPTLLENARLQNKSLKFNLDTAKQEQAARNKMRTSFNNFRA